MNDKKNRSYSLSKSSTLKKNLSFALLVLLAFCIIACKTAVSSNTSTTSNTPKKPITPIDEDVPVPVEPIPEEHVITYDSEGVFAEETTVIGSADYKTSFLSPGVFVPDRVVPIKAFWISDHEVTQAEYSSIMGKNSSYFVGTEADRIVSLGELQEKRPCDSVSWYEALVYCNKRSIKENIEPCYWVKSKYDGQPTTNVEDWGDIPTENNATWNKVVCNFEANGYRLPTEIEWEYAARGGDPMSKDKFPGTNDAELVNEYAFNYSNSGDDGTATNPKTHQVKLLKPNLLGTYDMSGNVWEWCWDRYSAITKDTPLHGAETGANRVMRGGSYQDGATNVAYSYGNLPETKLHNCGFRVVRTVVLPQKKL